MKHLDTIQRAYVIRCFASYLPIPETVDFFMDMFPYFGAHMREDTRRQRLTERFKKIKQKHAQEIQEEREKEPTAYWHIPITHRHVRIRHLKQLYDKTPDTQLTGTKKDKDGNKVNVYKYNAKAKVAILEDISKEVEHLKNDMPPDLYEELKNAWAQIYFTLLNDMFESVSEKRP